MAKKSSTCDGCHYSREHVADPANKVECHVRSVEKWPVRSLTSWCGEWRDPAVMYQRDYKPRLLGLPRYLNQLLTWVAGK